MPLGNKIRCGIKWTEYIALSLQAQIVIKWDKYVNELFKPSCEYITSDFLIFAQCFTSYMRTLL
jgi:hypothetical protein